MSKTKRLHELGQSLWLDKITREILDDGTLRRYRDELSITGLTSNPTIFDEAIGNSGAYDRGIRDKAKAGQAGEALFLELALEDLRRAATLFRPIFDATAGVDGWVGTPPDRGRRSNAVASLERCGALSRWTRTAPVSTTYNDILVAPCRTITSPA